MILVNGATGALGQAVAERLAGGSWVAGVRRHRASLPDALLIDEDGSVAPGSLDGIETIINCAGRIDGTAVEVERANVTHPVNLACVAKSSGVRAFVQVSSFSVYGLAERIDHASGLQPAGLYAETKAAAERQLLALADERFAVAILRLPFMFDRHRPSLVGSLIRIFRHLPIVPAPASPIQRSMISYGDAAYLLADLARRRSSGILAAADPLPFTYALLLKHMEHLDFHTPRIVPVPDRITGLVTRVMPRLGRRLFHSSLLEPSANLAAHHKLPIGLAAELDATLRGMA